MRSTNTLDFRFFLSQGYCTIANLSNEIFDRPYMTYFFKKYTVNTDDEGIVNVLDKYETVNLNPYIVVMEDKSMINIYSMIDQSRHY